MAYSSNPGHVLVDRETKQDFDDYSRFLERQKQGLLEVADRSHSDSSVIEEQKVRVDRNNADQLLSSVRLVRRADASGH